MLDPSDMWFLALQTQTCNAHLMLNLLFLCPKNLWQNAWSPLPAADSLSNTKQLCLPEIMWTKSYFLTYDVYKILLSHLCSYVHAFS